MSIFTQHRDEIRKYYEKTNKTADEHTKDFGKLVFKLNDQKGITAKINSNYDDFMATCCPKFKDWRTSINGDIFPEEEIDHVFDMNSQTFVKNCSLPNKKIIMRREFKLTSITSSLSIKTVNGTGCPYLNKNLLHYNVSRSAKLFSYYTLPLKKSCNCANRCNCHGWDTNVGDKILKDKHIKDKHIKDKLFGLFNAETSIIIVIDNYFNIYLPEIKTYFITNYTPFPLYGFYVSNKNLDAYHNLVQESELVKFQSQNIFMNTQCKSDNDLYNKLDAFHKNIGNFASSQDCRKEFKTTHFKPVFDFYEYTDKLEFFKKYLVIAEQFISLKPIDLEHELLPGENGESFEIEEKVFKQSNRIRELEKLLHQNRENLDILQNERKGFIEREHYGNQQIASRNKLIDDINEEISNLLKEVSDCKSKNIHLKKQLLKINDLTHKLNVVKGNNTSLELQIDEKDIMIHEKNTTINTLFDKQIAISEKCKVFETSNEKLEHTIYEHKLREQEIVEKTKLLESEMIVYTEKIQVIQIMYDELLINKETPVGQENKNNQYEELLLKQIKDKSKEIHKKNQEHLDLKLEKENIEHEFDVYKLKISNFISGV